MDTERYCGFAAVVVSILAFGSFAVPIKCEAARKVPVDPLVLQTYKVGVCFATCWLVLWFGVPFRFTPYGFVSGLLMVPGGTAGYFGVRNAGLAISQGIWSSLKVLVAFGWGIFMFHEPVRSKTGAALAVALMLVGLTGMSYFASLSSSRQDSFVEQQGDSEQDATTKLNEPLLHVQEGMESDMENSVSTTSNAAIMDQYVPPMMTNMTTSDYYDKSRPNCAPRSNSSQNRAKSKSVCVNAPAELNQRTRKSRNHPLSNLKAAVLGLSPRSLGIMGAIIDGFYGGSVLVPMHFARRDGQPQGLGFLISFGIGCWTVILLVWLARWAVYAVQSRSLSRGWQSLPSLHVSTIGPYATLAGLIWSLGNASSILSVALLGQGLGYSLIQGQLIVAGLWAVFFYNEIQGRAHISAWFAFAVLTVVSILLLTGQYESKSTPMEASIPESSSQ